MVEADRPCEQHHRPRRAGGSARAPAVPAATKPSVFEPRFLDFRQIRGGRGGGLADRAPLFVQLLNF